VRIRRTGDVVAAYHGSNGTNWTSMGEVTMTLPEGVYFGLAASAKSSTATVAAQFRNFTSAPVSPPAAPTDLEASAVSEREIDLTWTASPGINTYRVQRRLVGGSFEEIASGLTTTSFSDAGLNAFTTYEYQVLAENAAGVSEPSNTASATTHPPSEVPDAPTNLVGLVVSHERISLSWDAAQGATSYRVQRRLEGGVFEDVAIGVQATSYLDTGLTPGTTYEYQVIAENAAGLSDPSNIVSVTTPTGWVYSGSDIGNPGVAGSTSRIDNQSYSVTGSGSDIWAGSDQFHFAYRQLTGDFDIRVQITSVSLTQAKAGLMARESLAANSRNVFAGIGVDDAYRLAVRDATGGRTRNIYKSGTPVLPNVWIRLKRVGTVFSAYTSTNGVTWHHIGNATMSLPETLFFGMAVSSKSNTTSATAEFRNLADFV
jgi:regulation of enolase protein 1 (concanavalin A-like superfamily)